MTASEFTLIHTNDMHDRRTVFPFLERNPRTADSLLVDAGDAIRGSNTMFYPREPMLDLMSLAGYDAMAMGNREFHYVRGVLCRRVRQMNFPLVCSNVFDLRHKVNHAWRRTLVREVAGVRVGFLGLTPVQYGRNSLWKPVMGFRFFPWSEVLPAAVRALAARVDVVVLLSHQGVDTDARIASEVPGIHVIVGGHSHTVLAEPRRVGGCLIVQTGSYGANVGRMRLRVGADGSVEVSDYALLPTRGWALPAGAAALEEGGAA